jgi:chromosomal replication initiator protein
MSMSFVTDSNVWTGFLNSLRTKLSQESFSAWFEPIKFEGVDASERLMRLRAPNPTVRDWVKTNYSSVVDESFRELDLEGYLIDWTLTEAQVVTRPPADNQVSTQLVGSDLPLSDPNGSSPAGTPRPTDTVAAIVQKQGAEPGLNSRYTYDTFVVGSCNQFAHAASAAVAEAPGKTYNPLYIYGGVGLGKTHLMHACGNAIKARNKHLHLCYLSSEKFMNELINAIRYDRTQSFRERYRSVDVLLIDDVQFMAGKERTQEEFFHTFNSLYEQQKQIVISSDCPPRGIPTLEERLHSRFEWGLIADIEPPDLETKVAILKRKAETLGVLVPDEVALFIAGRVKNNIRELEGSLVRVVAISSLRGQPITKPMAQDALRHITTEEEPEAITIQKIQKAVAENHRIQVAELISKGNSRRLALPRQIAMYLCKRLTKSSYPEIGRAFGGKHHTTVIHSFEKIQSLVARDFALQKQVNDITQGLLK